jgi:hypothetical protein
MPNGSSFSPTCPRCKEERLTLTGGGAECAEYADPTNRSSALPFCTGTWDDAVDAAKEYVAATPGLHRWICPVGTNPYGCRQGEEDVNSVVNTGADDGWGCFSCGTRLHMCDRCGNPTDR